MEFWLILSGVVLLTCILLLAFLLKPKKTQKQTPKPVKKPVAQPPKATQPPNTQQERAKKMIEMEKNKRRRKEVRDWAGDNPVIAARFVRNWLWEGKKRR